MRINWHRDGQGSSGLSARARRKAAKKAAKAEAKRKAREAAALGHTTPDELLMRGLIRADWRRPLSSGGSMKLTTPTDEDVVYEMINEQNRLFGCPEVDRRSGGKIMDCGHEIVWSESAGSWSLAWNGRPSPGLAESIQKWKDKQRAGSAGTKSLTKENRMITPTVGRVVHYMPELTHTQRSKAPFVALIAYVHSNIMVNLAVFDSEGRPFSRGVIEVLLVQPENPTPQTGQAYCEWAPYQKTKSFGSESGEKSVGLLGPTPEPKPAPTPEAED